MPRHRSQSFSKQTQTQTHKAERRGASGVGPAQGVVFEHLIFRSLLSTRWRFSSTQALKATSEDPQAKGRSLRERGDQGHTLKESASTSRLAATVAPEIPARTSSRRESRGQDRVPGDGPASGRTVATPEPTGAGARRRKEVTSTKARSKETSAGLDSGTFSTPTSRVARKNLKPGSLPSPPKQTVSAAQAGIGSEDELNDETPEMACTTSTHSKTPDPPTSLDESGAAVPSGTAQFEGTGQPLSKAEGPANPEPTIVPEPTTVPEPATVPEPTTAPEPMIVPEPTTVPEHKPVLENSEEKKPLGSVELSAPLNMSPYFKGPVAAENLWGESLATKTSLGEHLAAETPLGEPQATKEAPEKAGSAAMEESPVMVNTPAYSNEMPVASQISIPERILEQWRRNWTPQAGSPIRTSTDRLEDLKTAIPAYPPPASQPPGGSQLRSHSAPPESRTPMPGSWPDDPPSTPESQLTSRPRARSTPPESRDPSDCTPLPHRSDWLYHIKDVAVEAHASKKVYPSGPKAAASRPRLLISAPPPTVRSIAKKPKGAERVRFGVETTHTIEVYPGRNLRPLSSANFGTRSGLSYLGLGPGLVFAADYYEKAGNKKVESKKVDNKKADNTRTGPVELPATKIGMKAENKKPDDKKADNSNSNNSTRAMGPLEFPATKIGMKLRRRRHRQAAVARYWMRVEEEEAAERARATARAEEEADRYSREPASPGFEGTDPVVDCGVEVAVRATEGGGTGVENDGAESSPGEDQVRELAVPEGVDQEKATCPGSRDTVVGEVDVLASVRQELARIKEELRLRESREELRKPDERRKGGEGPVRRECGRKGSARSGKVKTRPLACPYTYEWLKGCDHVPGKLSGCDYVPEQKPAC